MIHKYLNKSKFVMLIDILELQEIRGMSSSFNNVRQSFVQNKFIAQLIQPQNTDSNKSSVNIHREKILVNEMIT